MTVARGLFRLWVVFSALWIAGVVFEAWRTLPALVPVFPQPVFAPDAPVKPVLPDREAPFDPDAYLAGRNPPPPGYVLDPPIVDPFKEKWPGTPVNKLPHTGLSDADVGLTAQPMGRWDAILSAAQVAFLPPAFFLIFGTGLVWAIRGFRP